MPVVVVAIVVAIVVVVVVVVVCVQGMTMREKVSGCVLISVALDADILKEGFQGKFFCEKISVSFQNRSLEKKLKIQTFT